VEPIPNSLFANLLFHLLDAAKFDACGALCFVREHACAKIFFSEHFKVGVNLLAKSTSTRRERKRLRRKLRVFMKSGMGSSYRFSVGVILTHI